jgi:hypothetical protein
MGGLFEGARSGKCGVELKRDDLAYPGRDETGHLTPSRSDLEPRIRGGKCKGGYDALSLPGINQRVLAQFLKRAYSLSIFVRDGADRRAVRAASINAGLHPRDVKRPCSGDPPRNK